MDHNLGMGELFFSGKLQSKLAIVVNDAIGIEAKAYVLP
jgi:hypothetical protein